MLFFDFFYLAEAGLDSFLLLAEANLLLIWFNWFFLSYFDSYFYIFKFSFSFLGIYLLAIGINSFLAVCGFIYFFSYLLWSIILADFFLFVFAFIDSSVGLLTIFFVYFFTVENYLLTYNVPVLMMVDLLLFPNPPLEEFTFNFLCEANGTVSSSFYD